MKQTVRSTFLTRSILLQAAAVFVLWSLFGLYLSSDPENFDTKISLATFIAIPAAVIAITQLWVSAHIQRASYIKDYALRFRTDKELSESFHHLVYLFGNSLYDAYMKKPGRRTAQETNALKSAQKGISADLCFFNPRAAIGAPQERRLDNLLGFFDTLGYDFRRDLLHMRDIAGVFGFHLDHFVQRKVVQDYLDFVKKQWPTKESFHQYYSAPVPFRYLRLLLDAYIEFRKSETQQAVNPEEMNS